ncbi:hepatocellular carcinoma-associated antigen 59-domain-containing protein [Gongronella butleri]|nr:hepatocellular carcinoma-associated antigen 59-domain-containing protein [Gongronella butleri]
MPIVKKQRNYRKKPRDDTDDDEKNDETTETISDTIEDLQEIRRLRRKTGGVDAEKLFKGETKKKKAPKKKDDGAWNIKTGGLVDKVAYAAGKAGDAEEDEGKTKTLRLDTFTTQTNTVDVDKHMMEYIESELRKRRGGSDDAAQDEQSAKPQELQDIYEELYHLPKHLQIKSADVKEGSAQHSAQMLSLVPEVDLGISAQLKNIEETEKAKRKLMDDNGAERKESDTTIQHRFDTKGARQDQRHWATDQAVEERFRKRMRK